MKKLKDFIDLELLKQKIEEQKLTKKEVADYCGINKSTLHRNLTGQTAMNLSTFLLLNELLKIKKL